jgi:phosphoribosyl 1,2-cyclic phosphodiesterase
MIVKFWGVRGSIPSPVGSHEVKAKIVWALKRASGHDFSDEGGVERYVDGLPRHIKGTYGGNTPCVELQSGDTTVIFDAGSGIRALGMDLMKKSFGQGTATAHLLLSHTHWDHIQGLPFFQPAYVRGNRIVIYSPHPQIQERIETQQMPWYFPASIDAMGADIEFVSLSEGETIMIDDLSISNIMLKHPGDSFGYRVEKQGVSFVYATDTALNNLSESHQEEFLRFFSHAKVAVLDAQYMQDEAVSKEHWGHSTSRTGIDLALRAKIETLVLFHHEPSHDDHTLYERSQRARKYRDLKQQDQSCTVVMAYEGLQLEI